MSVEEVPRCLAFQLDMLKMEFEAVNSSIEHIGSICQGIKNWAIVTWTGSVGLLLGQGDLRYLVIFTGVLPLLFWFADAWWRRNQE